MESGMQKEKVDRQHPSAMQLEQLVPTCKPVGHKGQTEITGLGTVDADFHSNRFMKFQTNIRQVSLALAEHSGRQRGPHTQPAQSE